MLRIIFDTNVYGFLVKEKDSDKLEESIIKNKNFVVYGYKLIRRELRNIPKTEDSGRKARIFLLNLYDNITKNHQLIHTKQIEQLAYEYYSQCNKQQRFKLDKNTKIDLTIVASASIHDLDIVYSHDQKTVLSKQFIDSYKLVNNKYKVRTPKFLSYQELLVDLRGL